jgi:hypothetical protein
MKTETFLDRTNYYPGPWDEEPDRAEWIDPATGLNCLAKRNAELGFWCGYVGLPPGHPWHGKCHYEIEADVHGRLTYAADCMDDARPMRGQPDHLYWLGFDCGHVGDQQPFCFAKRFGQPLPMLQDQLYRTLEYVRQECTELARQAAEAGAKTPPE